MGFNHPSTQCQDVPHSEAEILCHILPVLIWAPAAHWGRNGWVVITLRSPLMLLSAPLAIMPLLPVAMTSMRSWIVGPQMMGRNHPKKAPWCWKLIPVQQSLASVLTLMISMVTGLEGRGRPQGLRKKSCPQGAPLVLLLTAACIINLMKSPWISSWKKMSMITDSLGILYQKTLAGIPLVVWNLQRYLLLAAEAVIKAVLVKEMMPVMVLWL